MKHDFVSGVLTVYLSGHIDSSNAEAIKAEIMELVETTKPSTVILDAEDLEYISSAGLRIILKLRQRFSDLRLINASTGVYEILEMTGFTEMITVEKAYRRFDISGCSVVGAGANGTVYRIDRDTIVKVYKSADSLDAIKRERELSRTAFVLGIPTAIPYDVVKVGDTYGSVFELLNAKSFDELLIEDDSNLDFVVKKSMEIAKIIHSTEAPENLPSQHEITLNWASAVKDHLDHKVYAKLVYMINALPETHTMIHGDFHIKNIMQQNNETLLIDMDTLCMGHPIYEFSFMFNAYQGFGILDQRAIEDFLGLPITTADRIWKRSLEVYFDSADQDKLREIEEKASIIGYLRLMRRVIRTGKFESEDGRKMFEACKGKFLERISRYDSFDFH